MKARSSEFVVQTLPRLLHRLLPKTKNIKREKQKDSLSKLKLASHHSLHLFAHLFPCAFACFPLEGGIVWGCSRRGRFFGVADVAGRGWWGLLRPGDDASST